MEMKGFTSVVLLFLLGSTYGFSRFKRLIPNGRFVNHPCPGKGHWDAVGHMNGGYTPQKNVFGLDFRGPRSWTRELCMKDSDGDGLTNGEELGDPTCTWRRGDRSDRNAVRGHPGFCEPDRGNCSSGMTHPDCPNPYARGRSQPSTPPKRLPAGANDHPQTFLKKNIDRGGMGQGMPGMGPGMQGMGQPMSGMGQPMPGMGPGMPGMGQGMQGMGQSMSGMGQSMSGMGQGMQGMGQPMPGMGQPMSGMGQPMSGMGQSMSGMGQPMPGMGQPMSGMGQGMQGMGQPTSGMGQPMSGMGQPMSGMGQGMPGMGQGIPGMGQGMSDTRMAHGMQFGPSGFDRPDHMGAGSGSRGSSFPTSGSGFPDGRVPGSPGFMPFSGDANRGGLTSKFDRFSSSLDQRSMHGSPSTGPSFTSSLSQLDIDRSVRSRIDSARSRIGDFVRGGPGGSGSSGMSMGGMGPFSGGPGRMGPMSSGMSSGTSGAMQFPYQFMSGGSGMPMSGGMHGGSGGMMPRGGPGSFGGF